MTREPGALWFADRAEARGGTAQLQLTPALRAQLGLGPSPAPPSPHGCPSPVWLEWVNFEPGAWKKGPVRGVTPTPCKRWSCEYCGRGKRAEALKLIRHGAQLGLMARPRQPLRFVTLTRPRDKPNHLDDRQDAMDASADVRELVKAWRRRGRQLEYVRVLERTKRGRIHVHLLTWGDYIPKCIDAGRASRGLPTTRDLRGTGTRPPCYCSAARPCIQRLAWDHGWGWVDVRAVRSPRRAAAYVSKYLGKQATDTWPRHARRLSYSRRFSGGLTLGTIHARWVADVRRRLTGRRPGQPLPADHRRWLGIAPTPVGQTMRRRGPPDLPRLPPKGGRLSHATGASLPVPF